MKWVFMRGAMPSMAPLLKKGAKLYSSPAQLAKASDVVFTMVTNSKDVEAVALGKNGIIEGARSKSLVIDMETIDPDVAKKIAHQLGQKGIDFLDAPVSGGAVGASEASLTIMVGGRAEVFERAKPLFECLGKTIVHMGPVGQGQIAKACTQLLLTITAQGTAEALSLAQRAGMDVAKVREVLLTGMAASRVLDVFGARMIDRNFAAGVESRLYYKDLNISLNLAKTLGVNAEAGQLTMQNLSRLMDNGDGANDLSSLIKVIETKNQKDN